jgi:hypothetical protein
MTWQEKENHLTRGFNRIYSLFNPLEPSGLLYVPPGLAFENSMLCPRIVFVCFAWVSDQTAFL